MAEYRNPQLEPGNERRFLLIFLVMFVIMLAFQPLLKKFMPQPPAQPQQAQSTPPQPAPTAAAAPATVAPTRVPAPLTTKQAASENETVIENDLYRITFTNRGAQVKSWLLKKYDNETGQPQDLVNAKAAAQYGYPLSLWTYDESLRSKLSSALYVTAQEGKLTAPATTTCAHFENSENPHRAGTRWMFLLYW